MNVRAYAALRTRIPHVAPVIAVLLFACDEGGGIGNIDERAFFEPEAIDFGTLRVGDSGMTTVRIVTAGVGEARVEAVEFEPQNNAYSVRTESGGVLRGAFLQEGASELRIFYGPTAAGDHGATMIVRVGGVEARLEISGVARERTAPMLTLDPTSIDFRDVELGRDAIRRFTLTNAGEEEAVLREVRPKSASGMLPFSVTAIGGRSPIGSTVPGEEQGALELEAHFAPQALEVFEDDLELLFDGGVTTTLGVRGTGAPAGVLSCDPTEVDFGPVARGVAAERTVHCVVMDGAYSIYRIGPTGSSSTLFSVPNPPTELAPDGSLDLRIVFDARGVAEPHTGAIEIASHHGSITRLNVRGEVVPPPPGATDITVTLSWNTTQTDFDLHLVRAGGAPFDGTNDCYYASKNPDWGAANDPTDDPFLDRDETEGMGPEQINLDNPVEELFDVFVHFYDFDTARPPPTEIGVQIGLRGTDAGTFRRTLEFCGSAWHVGQFDFSSDPPVFVPDTLITNLYRSQASARCQ
jgi:hypothetical protein